MSWCALLRSSGADNGSCPAQGLLTMLKRRYKAELIDDFSIQDERIDLALRELKLVNTFLGGKATTAEGFRILRKRACAFRMLKVLDVGSGGADVFGNNTENLSITALDRESENVRLHRTTFSFYSHLRRCTAASIRTEIVRCCSRFALSSSFF